MLRYAAMSLGCSKANWKKKRDNELRTEEVALNVASPLNQNHGRRAQAESYKVKDSTDPLVGQRPSN